MKKKNKSQQLEFEPNPYWAQINLKNVFKAMNHFVGL
jgi:hypothetical protein